MRSSDAALIVNNIFHSTDGIHYIKCTTKQGTLTTFSVQGITLNTLATYMWKHRQYPAPYLFRHTKLPHRCLSEERLAKWALQTMQGANIDTTTFKSHSLRGATATMLLQKGAPKHLVQSRGQWQCTKTLDDYYNRLHQLTNWEQMIGATGGPADSQASVSSLELAARLSLPEADEGRRKGESEQARSKEFTDLDALGLRRRLYDSTKCTTCLHAMAHEAAYRCTTCHRLLHIRCLALHPAPSPAKAQPERYTTQCKKMFGGF
jgi:hypothetical protein